MPVVPAGRIEARNYYKKRHEETRSDASTHVQRVFRGYQVSLTARARATVYTGASSMGLRSHLFGLAGQEAGRGHEKRS